MASVDASAIKTIICAGIQAGCSNTGSSQALGAERHDLRVLRRIRA
ncbi:hypothetical protein [Paenarthrobacter nitroguajacolicus]|nr:hypothetical protein [Paenarthrobacter nitroguajacolicus]